MEKTYIKPAIEVEVMETEDMIAASLTDGFKLSDVTETEETSGNLTRGDANDFWN